MNNIELTVNVDSVKPADDLHNNDAECPACRMMYKGFKCHRCKMADETKAASNMFLDISSDSD